MRHELEICAKPKQGVSIQDYITSETYFEVRGCAWKQTKRYLNHYLG